MPNPSKMLIDMGRNTADALLQPDGGWDVHGLGSVQMVSSMAISAERKARKVGFLPQQVERKIARSARIALEGAGQCMLADGSVFRLTKRQN